MKMKKDATSKSRDLSDVTVNEALSSAFAEWCDQIIANGGCLNGCDHGVITFKGYSFPCGAEYCPHSINPQDT